MVCHNQSDYKIGVIYFFRGPYVCEGAKTMLTSGDVVVQNGATVEFYSPSVTLNRGFRVEKGGVLHVNAARPG